MPAGCEIYSTKRGCLGKIAEISASAAVVSASKDVKTARPGQKNR